MDPIEGARRLVEPEDLFRLRFLTGADLSPDGGSVVFALTRTEGDAEHADLWLLDVASGRQRRLTWADAVHAQPAFSPDGREVAFLSTRSGTPQLHVMSVDGGEPRQLTALPGGVGGGPAWSPDGARIAFSAVPPGPARDPAQPYRVDRAIWRFDGIGLIEDALQEIHVVDAAGGDPRRLTADRFVNTDPRWTPDGGGLVYLAGFDPDSADLANRLRRVDLDGTVRDLAGGGLISAHAVCPDGRVVYVLTAEEGKRSGSKADLLVLDPATGGSERRTAELAADVGGRVLPDMPAFQFAMGALLADERSAWVAAQTGGEVHVLRVALDGPESHELVAGGARSCAPVALRGSALLFAAFGMGEPGDLHLHDGAEQRLTRLNAELLARLELPAVHHLEFAGGAGARVEGWFFEPAGGARPHPALLAVHGGPHAGWGHTFVFEFLMLAGAGYGVLAVNQRGSTGYGDEFATAIHGGWGNLDHADLMAGVDHAIAEGLADGDRLGVFGVSGGGTLTGWIIGHTDRFRAACPEEPLFDFAGIHGTSDIGIWAGRTFLGGDPHELPEVYRRCSPLSYAHRCTTPTLFLQHEGDLRSPPEQAERFYAVLKARGVEAEMLRFPGTGHAGSVLGPIGHRRAQNAALLDWMDRHVRAELS